MKKIITEISNICGVSERSMRTLLVELGLTVFLDKARRLQFDESFQKKELLTEDAIPARLIKKAYEDFKNG